MFRRWMSYGSKHLMYLGRSPRIHLDSFKYFQIVSTCFSPPYVRASWPVSWCSRTNIRSAQNHWNMTIINCLETWWDLFISGHVPEISRIILISTPVFETTEQFSCMFWMFGFQCVVRVSFHWFTVCFFNVLTLARSSDNPEKILGACTQWPLCIKVPPPPVHSWKGPLSPHPTQPHPNLWDGSMPGSAREPAAT